MNSKMTEKEARAACRFLTEAQWWAVRTIFDLEFAPEPARLPDRLEINSSGGRSTAQVEGPGKAWCFELIEVSPSVAAGQGGMQEQRKAVFEAAVARYNAYPGLREAAEKLVQRTIGSTAAVPLDLLQALDAELAKGPKP